MHRRDTPRTQRETMSFWCRSTSAGSLWAQFIWLHVQSKTSADLYWAMSACPYVSLSVEVRVLKLRLKKGHNLFLAPHDFISLVIFGADHSGSVVKDMNCFRSLECWDRGLESHWRNRCLYCVLLFFVFIVLCVGRGLATGSSPVQGFIRTVYRIKKLKNWSRPNKRL
jgi:hypothetical protein